MGSMRRWNLHGLRLDQETIRPNKLSLPLQEARDCINKMQESPLLSAQRESPATVDAARLELVGCWVLVAVYLLEDCRQNTTLPLQILTRKSTHATLFYL